MSAVEIAVNHVKKLSARELLERLAARPASGPAAHEKLKTWNDSVRVTTESDALVKFAPLS